MAPFDPQRLLIQRFGEEETRVGGEKPKIGARCKRHRYPKPDFTQDVFFLYDVPTQYKWDYDAEEEDMYDLRRPERQLSEDASHDFTRMQTVMLTANGVLSIFKDVDETDDRGFDDCHAQFIHRLQSWRDDSYLQYDGSQDQTDFDLKRLVVFADDNPVALKNLTDGKVELKDLVLENSSRYWTKYNCSEEEGCEMWRLKVKDDGFVQAWGKSLHPVLKQWVDFYLEGHRHWTEMLSLETGDVDWGSHYPMVDLPELWFARVK